MCIWATTSPTARRWRTRPASPPTRSTGGMAAGMTSAPDPIPALILAGTHSGSGKTTATLAVLAALARRGVRVQGFKVGPAFIDPGHHAALTGRPGRNLDTWLLDPAALAASYRRGSAGADLVV